MEAATAASAQAPSPRAWTSTVRSSGAAMLPQVAARVSRELHHEFAGALPVPVIATCARVTVADLHRSINGEALPEMAAKLATARLTANSRSAPASGHGNRLAARSTFDAPLGHATTSRSTTRSPVSICAAICTYRPGGYACCPSGTAVDLADLSLVSVASPVGRSGRRRCRPLLEKSCEAESGPSPLGSAAAPERALGYGAERGARGVSGRPLSALGGGNCGRRRCGVAVHWVRIAVQRQSIRGPGAQVMHFRRCLRPLRHSDGP